MAIESAAKALEERDEKSDWRNDVKLILLGIVVLVVAGAAWSILTSDPEKDLGPIPEKYKGGPVRVSDLKAGDCFRDSQHNPAPSSAIQLDTVIKVSCSLNEWTFRVSSVYEVSGLKGFPGNDFFAADAADRCPHGLSYVIHPTAESWVKGDRAVTCLEVP